MLLDTAGLKIMISLQISHITFLLTKKLIAANILLVCAAYRFYAKTLANKILSMTTIKQNIKLILNP